MSQPGASDEREVWRELRDAIAASSGFARWQLERSADAELPQDDLDERVRHYLRAALGTLAE